MRLTGFVACTLAAGVASELRTECRTKKPLSVGALLETGKSRPGVGVNLESLKPYDKSFKDGYSHVTCVNEGMRHDADLHEDPNSYAAQNVNVSVVWYKTLVPSEDRKEMTHDVCFNFCRSLENMHFFGIVNGRDCYCTPYYKAKAGGEDQMCDMPCDGNPAIMCGGRDKSDIFEMHLCADTEEDILDTIMSGRDLMSRLYEAAENLGTSAQVMQYIGSMSQIYGGQAGDVLAGDLAQDIKVAAGENLRVSRKAIKKYVELGNALHKLEDATEFDFSDAKKAAAADELIRNAKKVARELEDELAAVRKARDLAAGYRGTGHAEKLDQYKEITQWIPGYNAKNHEEKAEGVDSICNGKPLLGAFQGQKRDCAARCDDTVHPTKCTAFQHYQLVDYHHEKVGGDPEYVFCHWYGKDYNTTGGSQKADGMCDFITSTDRDSKTHEASVGNQNYEYAYGDFVIEGPVEFWIEPVDMHGANSDACFETWWYNDNGDYNKVQKTCGTSNEYFVTDASKPELGVQTLTESEVKDYHWSFDFGSHTVLTNYYGDYSNPPYKALLKRPKGDEKTGVCALFGEIDSTSYYTCPSNDSTSGTTAKCFLKVSEAKGWELHKDHVHRNERCMVAKQQSVPDYVEFNFHDEENKFK